jgi:hypothetical protein
MPGTRTTRVGLLIFGLEASQAGLRYGTARVPRQRGGDNEEEEGDRRQGRPLMRLSDRRKPAHGRSRLARHGAV